MIDVHCLRCSLCVTHSARADLHAEEEVADAQRALTTAQAEEAGVDAQTAPAIEACAGRVHTLRQALRVAQTEVASARTKLTAAKAAVDANERKNVGPIDPSLKEFGGPAPHTTVDFSPVRCVGSGHSQVAALLKNFDDCSSCCQFGREPLHDGLRRWGSCLGPSLPPMLIMTS
jgi:hypothetical protein